MKKHIFKTIRSNAVDPASSFLSWEKHTKRYNGVACKGGKTTNYIIPKWMFERELKEMKEGAANA